MNDSEKKLLELLSAVAETEEDEIDCDEFLQRVSGCIERMGPELELTEDFQQMAQHMKVCRECCEEFEALLSIHRSEDE